MHVALLSPEYPPFYLGGIGTFTRNLARTLCKSGVEVTVLCGYPWPRKVKKYETGEIGSKEPVVLRFPYLNVHPKNITFQLVNMKDIIETVESVHADVVQCQAGSSFFVSSKLKGVVPLVTTFHSSPRRMKELGIFSLLRGGTLDDFWIDVISYPIWNSICAMEIRNSTVAVAVSRDLQSDLVEGIEEKYRDRIREIHNGIDLEELDQDYDREESSGEPDDAILFAGRLAWIKGPLNLLKVAYLLNKKGLNNKIIIHGDGPLLSKLKKEVQSLGLTNVEIKGFANRRQLMRSMKRSKFVIVPSFYEACPMILLESMCLGKIPLLFDLPYTAEFTENGEFGVVAKNFQEMSQKIRLMSVDQEDLKNFSKKIRDFAREKYDIHKMVSKYLKIYGEALNNPSTL